MLDILANKVFPISLYRRSQEIIITVNYRKKNK